MLCKPGNVPVALGSMEIEIAQQGTPLLFLYLCEQVIWLQSYAFH